MLNVSLLAGSLWLSVFEGLSVCGIVLFLLLGHLEAHADMVHCFKRSSDSTIVPFNLRALTVWNI